MPKIFISYRRDDTGYIATMIAQRLKNAFGDQSVFLDVDNIPLGIDFRNHLDQAISRCDVVLVLIGASWLESRDRDGNLRLQSPDDFVRLEVELALSRGIPVIPVLGDKAKMPTEDQLPASIASLAYRNASEMRSGRDLLSHLDRLVEGIEKIGQPNKDSATTSRTDRTVHCANELTQSGRSTGEQSCGEQTSGTSTPIIPDRTLAERLLLTYPPKNDRTRLLHRTFHIALLAGLAFSLTAMFSQLPGELSPTARIASRTIAVLLPYPLIYLCLWIPARLGDRTFSRH